MTTKAVLATRDSSVSSRVAKNIRISQAQKETRERRKLQTCRVYELKIQANKLSDKQAEALKMLFVEAKWLYNETLSQEDVFQHKPGKTVIVKVGEKYEERSYQYLGSQMKQSVVAGVQTSIKTLNTLKKKGKKVGALRYKSDYTSINLKQFGTTYRLDGSRAKIQNVPGWVRVAGAHQLDGWELANAKLVKKPSGYYLKITAFKDKNLVPDQYVKGAIMGVDMGVKTHLTLSNGSKVDSLIEETDRLKRLQRKLSRQVKGSNNYEKTRSKIKREYERMDHRKNDSTNKIVHDLLLHEVVVIQDENIASWKRKKRGYVKAGKNLQHSVLGRVKAKLVHHPRVIVLDRFERTTNTCACGEMLSLSLSDRVVVHSCGHVLDRDVHAARNMIKFAFEKSLIPQELRDFKPVESL